MKVKIDKNLIELVKSVKNRADIFLILCGQKDPQQLSNTLHPDAERVSATLLEDMFEDCQTIIQDYCKEE